jgi:hypothetical protein
MLASLGSFILFAALTGAAAPVSSHLPQGARLRVTAAQTPLPLALPGARATVIRTGADDLVLVPGPGRKVTGILVGESEEALLMRLDGRTDLVRIPRAAMARVEVSAGRPPRVGYILGGGVVGVMAGLLVGSVLDGSERRPEPPRASASVGCGMPLCNFEEWLAGALTHRRRASSSALFGVLGAWLGAGVGAALARERWLPVEKVNVGVAVFPSAGGAALSLAVRF